MANWSAGPPLLVLSVGCLMPIRAHGGFSFAGGGGAGRDPLNDLLLCAGLLAYAAGHYRLQAVLRWVFPPEPRPAPGSSRATGRRARAAPAPAKRSGALVTSSEVPRLAMALPVWCGLAFVLWRLLPPDPGQLGGLGTTRWGGWRGLALCWLALLGLGAVWAALGYLGRSRATPEESLVYLQDQFWRETVREQGRVQRWLVWARLRRQRREGQ
jgi:hypothetical protein